MSVAEKSPNCGDAIRGMVTAQLAMLVSLSGGYAHDVVS